MAFAYINPAGINKHADIDIDVLLESRWNSGRPKTTRRSRPRWTTIAKAASISYARLTEIRKSDAWTLAVANFLHGKGERPLIDTLDVFGVKIWDLARLDYELEEQYGILLDTAGYWI